MVLSHLSGRKYTRQGVQQLWKRKDGNGFPDRRRWSINGHERWLLDMQEVADWYAFAEAAAELTALTGRMYTPSEIFRLWKARKHNGFPDRGLATVSSHAQVTMPETREAFSLDKIALWWGKREQRHPFARAV